MTKMYTVVDIMYLSSYVFMYVFDIHYFPIYCFVHVYLSDCTCNVLTILHGETPIITVANPLEEPPC